MQIDVITLFPQMFDALRDYGIGRVAIEKQALSLRCYNPRDFTADNYRTIDDRPYGGGPGMVMMPAPLAKCIDAGALENDGPLIYLSPQGQKLDQAVLEELSSLRGFRLLCGRYEGVDERVLNSRVDREISIGDYVLAGGEFPAMVIIEAIARLLPGVLGNALSAQQDSFADGLLDCPHYTRPEVFEDVAVPAVLLSGDHKRIERWRLQQSLARTEQRRPELISGREFDELEQNLLKAFHSEQER